MICIYTIHWCESDCKYGKHQNSSVEVATPNKAGNLPQQKRNPQKIHVYLNRLEISNQFTHDTNTEYHSIFIVYQYIIVSWIPHRSFKTGQGCWWLLWWQCNWRPLGPDPIHHVPTEWHQHLAMSQNLEPQNPSKSHIFCHWQHGNILGYFEGIPKFKTNSWNASFWGCPQELSWTLRHHVSCVRKHVRVPL